MKKWVLLITTFLLCLLGAEVYVRNRYPITVETSIAPNSRSFNRGRFSKPGQYRNQSSEFDVLVEVNSQGFVDHEWPAKSSKKRILLLGDSFVQAAQVPLSKGIGRHLESLLPNTEVLSIGVPGAGTITELALLQEYQPLLQPDLVILGVLLSNDISNNHPNLESKQDKPFYDMDVFLQTGTLELMEMSPVVQSPIHLWNLWSSKHHQQQIIQQKLHQGDGIPLDLYVHAPNIEQSPEWDESWQLSTVLIAKMQQQCHELNIDFLVVLFPTIEQVSNLRHYELCKEYPKTCDWDFEQQAINHFKELTQPFNLKILDLQPTFQNALNLEPNTALFFPKDGHWNSKGHALAAEQIALYVQSLSEENINLQVEPDAHLKDAKPKKDLAAPNWAPDE